MLQRIEAIAAWLWPWRWVFYAGCLLGIVNSAVMHLTDPRMKGALGFHYYMISTICCYASVGLFSWIHWFAPGRGDDPRPRARRVYRIAVAYAVVSTAIPLGLAGFFIYAYASMSAMIYRDAPP